MEDLKEVLIQTIKELRKRKNGMSYSFGEIGFMIFETVRECISLVENDEI